MRTIKFRALRDDMSDCNFVYGNLIYNEVGEPCIFNYENYNHITCLKGTEGQFIGLHDKNGKEIFEGDVYTDKTGRKFLITFNNGAFMKFNGNSYFCISESEIKIWNGEIIGNIHENSELLTK